MNGTVLTCLKAGTEMLEQSAVPEARASAEALLSHVLLKKRFEIYTDPDRDLDPESSDRFRKLILKRSGRYPLQYLLKSVSFYDAELWIDEQCLIPRPETEFLVEVILKEMENKRSAFSALDIGTGSGNIAVSLAKARSDWRLVGTDISQPALNIAKRNAARNGVQSRVDFFEADLWPANFGRQFDLVVSNPPYLTAEEMGNLQPEVAFEPIVALDGGPDGLVFYRRIIGRSREILKPGGCIYFEVGIKQAVEVRELLCLNHFESVTIFKDYSGIERVVSGRLEIYG